LLIVFAVLRYNGNLVVYTTVLVIVSHNISYALIAPEITDSLTNKIVSIDWGGQIFRNTYLALMGYFMYSIPKIMDKLIVRHIDTTEEHNKTEIKLALLKQKEKLVSLQLEKERALTEKLNNQALLINKEKEKLEIANTTKDRLFSIVGHDLRSPFSTQCSLSELLETDYDNLSREEVLEIISAINKSAHQGIGLLSNLLDWATAENSNENIIPGPVSIQKIVTEAMALFHNNAKHKNIEVTTSIDNDLTICVDGNMLETIIRNLISNAIKFSPKKSVVTIKAIKKANNVIINVTDNGIGMTPEHLAGLFKISKSLPGTEDEPGTGVGLMLCKELVEKNNGSIEVKSSPGKGSTFIVKLPAFSQSSVN
jgi:signal transduction histidine kinase